MKSGLCGRGLIVSGVPVNTAGAWMKKEDDGVRMEALDYSRGERGVAADQRKPVQTATWDEEA